MTALDKEFLLSFIPEPVVLLNQKLKPYSLGHQMLLERFDSPFLAMDRDPGEEDLFLAVLICASTYQEALDQMRADNLGRVMTRWMMHCKRDRGFDLDVLVTDFDLYRLQGSHIPPFRNVTRKGIRRSATHVPLIMSLYLFLCRELSLGHEQSLDFPYGAAHWLYCAHLEREGAVVMTPVSEAQEMDSIRKRMAELGMEPITVDMNQQN